jgi:hypothetical protein
MGVIDIALHKAMRSLVIYPVLLIAIVTLAILLFPVLLFGPEAYFYLDLEVLLKVLPFILLAALIIALELWTINVAPLKKLSRVINILKSFGYRIDDSRYIVVSDNITIIEVTDCSQIPKNATYTVAAISRRRGIEMFVGIMDEQRRVYRLLNVSIDTCRGY